MWLALLGALASAQEVGAIARTDLEIDLAHDREGEDTAAARTRVRAFARGETRGDGVWFLEVRGVHELLIGEEVLFEVPPDGAARTSVAPGLDLEGLWFGEIGESGWEGKLGGPFRLRVGNLVERWGKLDLLPVADVLNPRELRFGLVQPQEFQRIPVPMATVSVGTQRLRSETTFLPFPSRDRIALRGTDWSVLREGMFEGQAVAVQALLGDSTTFLSESLSIGLPAMANQDASYRRAMDVATLERRHPEDTGLHPELAQRVVFEGKGFDAAVMGAAIYNRQPLAMVDPTLVGLLYQERLPETAESNLLLAALQESIPTVWPRTFVGAAELATVVGPVGIRVEGAAFSDKVVRMSWGQAGLTPTLGAGLGLDYVRGSSLQIGLEARYERLLWSAESAKLAATQIMTAQTADGISPYRWENALRAADGGQIAIPQDYVFVRPNQLQIAGGLRASVLADRLQLQLGGTYDVTFGEFLALPKLTWRVDDHLQLEGGAMLLGGTKPPERLPGALTYEGGLLGYFGQNDAITLGAVWIL